VRVPQGYSRVSVKVVLCIRVCVFTPRLIACYRLFWHFTNKYQTKTGSTWCDSSTTEI